MFQNSQSAQSDITGKADLPILGNRSVVAMDSKDDSRNDKSSYDQTDKNRTDIVSIEPNSDALTKEEASIKALKKYNEIVNSPEFMAESHNILFNSKIAQIEFEENIRDLESKEKELEHSLMTASPDRRGNIEDDLGKIKNELWEVNVELATKIILTDDTYQKLKLRYITVDEIRLAQQEISKEMPSFLSIGGSDQIDLTANDEAIRRLKAGGWIPNPLRSYQ